MKKGKFIVIYGTNNLGKSTQARLMVKAIRKEGKKAEYIKYPIYDSEPSGKLINEYLRKGNPNNFSPREFQLVHFIDRIKFEPILKNKLGKGINIVAEDYFGTAVAWGTAAGVDRRLLEYLYKFVLKEDIAFLFNGKRFEQSLEKNHKHETDKELMEKVSKTHLQIGKKYGWERIDANLPINEIHNIIWNKVKDII
jgi:thymidylate kinase